MCFGEQDESINLLNESISGQKYKLTYYGANDKIIKSEEYQSIDHLSKKLRLSRYMIEYYCTNKNGFYGKIKIEKI